MGAVLCGLVPAFMGKTLAAVLLGHVVAQLPHAVVTWVTVFTFLLSAVMIWREHPAELALVPAGGEWRRAAPMAFAAVFFTEWADAGQLVTAGLAARYPSPLIVWSAATLALTTKGVLALSIGVGLRRVVPETFMRYGAITVCLAMAIISASGIDP
jgi:putative Ca2+/H+ antiporter (TMEM165/GDT1 family)